MLHPQFEAIYGPSERLLDGETDLILHHIDKTDPRLEFTDLITVKIVPVVAPNFLKFPISKSITPGADAQQCADRDPRQRASLAAARPLCAGGARSWTVSDQLMKCELILQGMGWGHMPRHLVERVCARSAHCRLQASTCGREAELVAARLRDAPHGPVASRLWQFISDEATRLVPAG